MDEATVENFGWKDHLIKDDNDIDKEFQMIV